MEETHPLNIAIKTEDVENAVCINLERVKTINHDDRGVCLSSVVGRRAVTILRASVTRSATGPAQRWSHPPALIMWRRRTISFIVVTITTLGTTYRKQYNRGNAVLLHFLKKFFFFFFKKTHLLYSNNIFS